MKLSQWSRLCYGASILVAAISLSACNSQHQPAWKLLHYDNFTHASSVGPIVFENQEQGWSLRVGELSRLTHEGRTWTARLTSLDEKRTFYSFTFTSPKNGVVVGTQKRDDAYNVLILQTSDGGNTWQERSTNVSAEKDRDKRPTLLSVSFCGESGWTVGDNLILHTQNGGETWETQMGQTNGERLFTVACLDAQHAWAAGTGGLLLRTSDGGDTWRHQDSGTKDVLMQVRFFDGIGWIVGGTNERPVLLQSRDAGEGWQSQSLDVTAGLFDIFFLGTDGWIAGEKGTILKSDDGGRHWSPQKAPTTENLTCLFFLSPNEGWAGGDRGTLLRFSH